MATASTPRADFRSDTVTVPTQPMLEAMMGAAVGDSVYGEDPTELALCAFMAETTGMQAGLFCCTGVMTNQVALRVNTHRARVLFGEVLFARGAHLGFSELGGAAYNSRVQPVAVPFTGDYLTADDVRRSLCLGHDLHRTTTIGVCVENTMVMPLDELKKISALCKEHGLFLHMDGARLWNASVATGVPVKQWAGLVDSLSLCFSKGLGAPVGSILLGSRDMIEQAREVRKAMGGGWRQCGYLAAACLYAAQHNVERLQEDHENAARLHQGLTGLGLRCTKPDTNVLFVDTTPLPKLSWDRDVVPALSAEGITVFGGERGCRLVVHMQTPRAAVDKLLQVVAGCVERAQAQ